MKVRNGNSANDAETIEITVYDYFANHWETELRSSADFPCLDVGKPKRPIYLPLELYTLVLLQHYTKSLSSTQKASLAEKSRQKPQERMRTLTDAVRNYRYDEDPVISACSVSIERQLTEVDGCVLVTPELKVGNNENCIPRNGHWTFNNMVTFVYAACVDGTRPVHFRNIVYVCDYCSFFFYQLHAHCSGKMDGCQLLYSLGY